MQQCQIKCECVCYNVNPKEGGGWGISVHMSSKLTNCKENRRRCRPIHALWNTFRLPFHSIPELVRWIPAVRLFLHTAPPLVQTKNKSDLREKMYFAQ